MQAKKKPTASEDTSSTQYTNGSVESYGSVSTGPSSLLASSRPSTKGSLARALQPQTPLKTIPKEDLSPSTSLCARSSVETYSSLASSEDLIGSDSDDDLDIGEAYIPQLPPYRHEIEEFNVRPSTPSEFAALFPSLDRFSIRHDDFTSDGNMNLRVETTIHGRHKETIQLFHLRMYDLNRRDFSLRRYCRSSGREVCNSKRRYIDSTNNARPALQRSLSNAFQTLAGRPKVRRLSTAASIRSAKSTKSRPGTGYSTAETFENDFADVFEKDLSLEPKPKARLTPTNTIKLEFSNYARVDLERRGTGRSKRYTYSWWGEEYAWKRVVDSNTNALSFHLIRNGNKALPVAHIVAETRAPNQVADDEHSGGWVPPCHMWISDETIMDLKTDVADVIISTGLLALVDDCIKDRWQSKKASPYEGTKPSNPRAFVQNLLSRRQSDSGPSPLRFQRAAVAP